MTGQKNSRAGRDISPPTSSLNPAISKPFARFLELLAPLSIVFWVAFTAGCGRDDASSKKTAQPTAAAGTESKSQTQTTSDDTGHTAPAGNASEEATPKPTMPPVDTTGFTKTASGLYYKIVKEGDGPVPQEGQTVKVHYTGKLANNFTFDSSKWHGEPISFPLGKGRVIKGWDEGIALLKVGTTAQLIIPPDLGYGANGVPPTIPPNATLLFDVELLGAK